MRAAATRWWCALLVVGCQPSPGPPAPPPDPAPRPAVTVEAARDYVGLVVTDQTVELTPRLAGRVANVTVRLGDGVKAGQVVAALDIRALQADLEAARAALRAARADVERMRLELAEAHEKSGRTNKLKEFVSQEELSGASYREKLAEARLGRARADVASAEARVRQEEVAVADAEIRAPFDGVVAARYVDPGASVTPAVPIVRIIASNRLLVRFALPEDQARSLRPGDPVRVGVDTLGASFEGTVRRVSPEVDAAARLVFAEAQLVVPGEWQGKVPAGVAARVYRPRRARARRPSYRRARKS
jgi:membrane fusion protein, multidrug efflux system